MADTTAAMLQDRLNDIERNAYDGIDFRQELNEAYALADELRDENTELKKLCAEMWETITEHNRVTFAKLLRFGERLVKLGVIE